MYKLLVCIAFLAVGTSASVVPSSSGGEGPPCPIDDPLVSYEPLDVNGTSFLPAFELFPQGSFGPLTIQGLSALHYEYDVPTLLLRIDIALSLPSFRLETSYKNIFGSIGLAPIIPSSCFPSGIFKWLGDIGAVTMESFAFDIETVLFINIISNKITIRILKINSFEIGDLSMNFGSLTINDEPVDWDGINFRLPTCILEAFHADSTGFTELARQSINSWIGAYTMEELLDLIGTAPGTTCPPLN